MNPDIKAKWLEALRSGKYRQGRHVLRGQDYIGATQYCCLGVLCDIAAREGVGEWVGDTYTDHGNTSFDNDMAQYSRTALTQGILDWAGLPNDYHHPGVRSVMVTFMYDNLSLAELNDSYGQNFLQIANIIEAQL